jgi:Protein of unknown function (DUF2442)
MIPKLQSAEYAGGYRIRVRFADGRTGDIDLEGELWGEVFEPLKDLTVFKRFRVDTELNTISWETGADLAPEFLYEKAAQPRVAADAPPARR